MFLSKLSFVLVLLSSFSYSFSEESVGVVHILNFPADSPANPYYQPPPIPRPPPEPAPGYISFDFDLSDGEEAEVTLTPRKGSPIKAMLTSKGGKVQWKSQALHPGHYDVSYSLPPQYEPIPTQTILLTPHQNYQLAPQLKLLPKQGTVQVYANIPDALYLLTSLKTKDRWKGDGKDFLFEKIPPGSYELSFSATDPGSIPPREIRFTMADKENKEYRVVYELSGSVTIETNIYPSQATFQQITGKKGSYEFELTPPNKTITLPEGRYRVQLSTSETTTPQSSAVTAPRPLEITVRPLSSQDINLPFTLEAAPPKPAVPRPTPLPILSPVQQVALVPKGPALIGDPASQNTSKWTTLDTFSIGIYEVTNAQYAAWLNDSFKNGTIAYISEADRRGQVLDMEGHLLFKTYTADPYSQIAVHQSTNEGISFSPIPGKDQHPVINVSWHGAVAYCTTLRCRLPTEAEWEKAGGMSPPQKNSSDASKGERFIFGFGQNTIDRTWANYRDTDRPLQSFRVLTTPVGFYNGSNTLPLTLNHKQQETTHDAKSPYGPYDMSGNVWEWVSDWYSEDYIGTLGDSNPKGPTSGTQKVAKGGCYDSLADGVRISERIALPLEYADAYTGFRIAIDQ